MDAPQESSYCGTVKAFNPERGWGHIQCPETEQMYGKDVFLLRSQMQNGGDVIKGASVMFSVVDNGRGPEAVGVQVINGGPTSVPPGGKPYVDSLPAGHHAGPEDSTHWRTSPAKQSFFDQGGEAMASYSNEVFWGTVKSYNPASGWGHITCERTHSIYEKDIFFMKSQLSGQNVDKGCQVTFTVATGLKGPEARNINVLDAKLHAGHAVGHAYGGGHMAMSHHFQPHLVPQFGILTGTVKSFNESKGWGHIDCATTRSYYGKDIFVMRSAVIGAIKVGDSVQFTVVPGRKGPEARDVKVITTTETDVFTGQMKIWNEQKGYGFISCEDTLALYGKDIFVHKKDLNGYNPSIGETVYYSVQISMEGGRPEATRVGFASANGYAPHRAAQGPMRAEPY